MKVGEGRVDVVDLGRPLRLTGEPVLAGQGRVAGPAERDAIAAELGAITADEAAAMDQEHPRTVGLRRSVQVSGQSTPAALTHDHRLDFHSLGHAHLSSRLGRM